MKTIFILKITPQQSFGYFDGKYNWAASPYDAEQYDTYPIAEKKIEELFKNGSGGMIQIEKYFLEDDGVKN